MKYIILLITLSSLLLAVNSIPSPTRNRYDYPTQSPLYDEEIEQNSTPSTNEGLSLDQANNEDLGEEAPTDATAPPGNLPRNMPRALLNDIEMFYGDGDEVQAEHYNNNSTNDLLPIPSWMSELPLPSDHTNNNLNHNIMDMIPAYVVCNKALLEQLVFNKVVLFGYAAGIGDWKYLHERLMWLNRNRHLLLWLYGRGAFTSGSWKRTRPIIEEIPTIREWFRLLEKSFIIRHGWVLNYAVAGRHPYHPDGKYKGQYRMILTLGANGKWMWWRKNKSTTNIDDMVAAHIDHAMTVFMTEEGGGGLGVEHGVFGDVEGSWFIGLELDLRDDEEFLESLRIFREGGNDEAKEEDEEKKEEEKEDTGDEQQLQDAIALSLQNENGENEEKK